MVNPGVVFLVQKKIAEENFCIEDNIGESIHIHWGHMRLDTTIKELLFLTEQLADTMNLMIGKSDFDIRNMDIDYLYERADMLINISADDLKDAKYEMENAYKSRKDKILECMNTMLPLHLKKKKVALKGAGEHTREIVKLWKDKVNIVGILSKDKAKIEGYQELEYEQLNELSVDTIIISSYRYKDEMLKEVNENVSGLEIIDLYKYIEYLGIHGIEQEFYKYL